MSLDASFTRQHVLAKKGPVDGDGDGWVYDGTPKKRPATPAEMAAGARLRAKQGKKAAPARPGAKKAPAKKAAAPKNEYEKRVAKFERAIAQAVRSGDKKKIKEVHDLIGQDFILKKPERDRLQKTLADLAAGKAPAKKVPAAAPAKKAAAKVPAKKAPAVVDAERKKRDEQMYGAGAKEKVPDAAVGRGKPAGSVQARIKEFVENDRKRYDAPAGKKAAPPAPKRRQPTIGSTIGPADAASRVKDYRGGAGAAAPKQDALKQRIAQSNAKKKLQEAASKSIDSEKGANDLADAIVAAREAGVPDADLAPFRDRLRAAKHHLDRKAAQQRMSLERRAAKKAAAKRPSKPDEGASWDTTHGPKTQAWFKHAQRDIANAQDFRTLKGRMTQVNNLLKDKRITAREGNLLKTMIRQRLRQLGLDENGKPKAPTWRDRIRSVVKPKTETSFGNLPTPKTDSRDPLKMAKEAAAFRKRIDDAKTDGDLKAIQRDIAAPAHKNLREWLVMDAPQAKAVLDDAFALAKNRIRAKEGAAADVAAGRRPAKKAAAVPPTIIPKDPPGAARRKAMNNLPEDWARRIAAAQQVSEVEGLMDDLEQDKSLDNDAFNKVAEALNDQMNVIEDDANAFAQAGVEFDEVLPKEARARLDAHFAKKTGTIGNAPTRNLYHYLVVNPDRFEVKQQTDNKGVSGIDIITDKQTGERWFAKHSAFDNDYGKEKLAADVLNMAGISKHSARVSYVGEHNRQGAQVMRNQRKPTQVLLLQDALQGNGLDGDLKVAGKMRHDDIAKEAVDKGLQEHDPQGLVDMAIFDYLIDNAADRHSSNAFFQKKGSKLKVMFLDHGLAFGSAGHNMDTRVGYRDWFASRYRANRQGGWDISRLIGESVKGRDDLARRVSDAIEKFDGVEFDRLRQQYEDAVAGDERAMRHVDEMFNLMEIRLERMRANADQIINVLVDAGGVL